jgi:hypothetical protein
MTKQLLYDSTREVEYEEYFDYCFVNDIEPMGEESEDYYDYVVKVRDWEWDDFLCNIVYSEVNEYEWLITGTVGTWRGEFDVYPTIEPSLEHAIISCIGRGDCEAIIEKCGNTISVEIIHHDGRNHFSLVALTEDGADRFRRHGEVSLKRKENVVKLPEFLF